MSEPLTLERLYQSPSLSGPTPRGLKYSPDGKRVTFLRGKPDDADRLDLWSFDIATGEERLLVDSRLLEPEDVELDEAEKALRERKRIAGLSGIVSYDWGSPDQILVPIGGDLYLVTLTDTGPEPRRLTETDATEYDARVTPDRQSVSFVRDGAVYAIDLASGQETRLTPLAEPENAISYGVAEFVAQEEMDRYTGYWWSPDARYLAYTRVDESTVDIIPRYDISAGETTVIEQRYPRAGRLNAIVDLFVRDMETGEAVEVDWRHEDWGPATDQYLTRVGWRNEWVIVEAMNRNQTRLEIKAGAAESGWQAWAFTEVEQPNWINLTGRFRGDAHPHAEIMVREDSGFRHIWVRPFEDSWQALTRGDWNIADFLRATEEGDDFLTGKVMFTGFMDTPLERHLYSVAIDPTSGEMPTRLTELGKSWSITMAPAGKTFIGRSSSPTQPPQTGLYRVTEDEDMELIAWIEENALTEGHPYFPYLADHTVPDYGTLTAEDGQTLHYSIQTPPGFDPTKKYPVIVQVYGGPGVQTVDRDWERMDDQFYTRQGYIVFRLDNRGTANRGKKFEDVIYRQMGIPEVRDQLLGVDWLKSQPFVDPDRIAIQGWSYGGYMTLMTMLQAAPDTFAAAVSGAPVTDWTLYDTFYTERYMDTPLDNPDGYEKGSVFYHLDRFEGDIPPLLLIHGMADDNVTFDNTTRLVAELQARGDVFDLMTYPGQRHGIRGETLRTHLMRTRMAFLDRHLKAD